MTVNHPVLEARDLHLSFGSIKALTSVSVRVEQNEILAIIGPNGAGKSSLLNCLCGFYRPSSGSILFQGKEIGHVPPHGRAALGIARTFQGIQTYQNMSVRENILSGFHVQMKTGLFNSFLYWGAAQSEMREYLARAECIIEFLELEELRHVRVGDLGYGLRKRVDLGRALALSPRLLIMDEPMAGMNAEEKGDLVRYILDIREALHVPIVLVEHDMEVVMDISDRVMVMEWGTPIADDVPEKVRNDPRIISAYLGQS